MVGKIIFLKFYVMCKLLEIYLLIIYDNIKGLFVMIYLIQLIFLNIYVRNKKMNFLVIYVYVLFKFIIFIIQDLLFLVRKSIKLILWILQVR